MRRIKILQLLKFLLTIFLFVWFGNYLVSEFGLKTGLHSLILTWTFFVICTPTTNGGIIIDIPFYLLTGKRIVYSELGIWIGAIIFNLLSILYIPRIYFKNSITHLLYQIISKPWPFWLIIVLCSIGTFYSIIISDATGKIMNPLHKRMNRLLFFISLFITLYFFWQEYIIIINTPGNP